jgi:glycosyltransferase involved in cell wall biosynthesis
VQCNSEYVKKEIDSKYHISSFYVPNGIDLAELSEKLGSARRTTKDDAGEFSIVTICNMRKKDEKDIITLIDVAGVLGTITFTIIGTGTFKQYFENYARKSGVKNVIFAGYQEDVFHFLSKSDCYIHLTKTEGFSNAILEAMAASVPVIASNIPQISLLFTHKTHCLLVENGNIPSIVDAINLIKSDTSLRNSIIAHAKELVHEKYSIQNSISENYKTYLELLGKKA